jgi:oxepin-CoA hydrolase/3-oxo-5,6-dehydrosuberyl-CoA semialdehyde dehydrogenase
MSHQLTIETWTPLLMSISEDAVPKWGVMRPQNMIEHVSVTFAISNGKINATVITPPEKIESRKTRFFQAETPFPHGVIAPGTNPGQPNPLRYASLEEAKSILQQHIERFFKLYAENPDATPSHPFFGPLTQTEWLLFHVKHLRHHLTQFGLLPEEQAPAL